MARCEIDAGDSHNAEIVNARGALKLLDGVDVTKERIETWVPRVMRYAFRLTPVNVQTVQPLEKSV